MNAPRRSRHGDRAALVAISLTVLGTLIDDMGVAAAIVPIVFGLGVYVMTVWPLHASYVSLVFLAITLSDPSDASAAPGFQPPFTGAAAALLTHLNAAARPLGINWAAFSVIDLWLVVLYLIARRRHKARSKIDLAGFVPVPQLMTKLVYVAYFGTMLAWFVGLATGGDFGKSLWQLNRVMYLPLIGLLGHMCLRGAQDFGPLLKSMLIAAGYKSALALYVVLAYPLPPDPTTGSTRPAWAISHQDSILFATAFATVFTLLLERIGGAKRALRLAMWMVPLIGGGMWANNRRTAWVQVGLVFFTVYMLAKDNAIKRRIRQALIVIAPVAAIYVAIGWNGGGKLFKPVHMMRSIVDAKSDGSSNWRELENFNLRMTLKANPIFGTGYGHQYYELITMPPVPYDLEFYCPHNSFFAVWSYTGVVGFSALTAWWVAAIYLAIRSYHRSNQPEVRAAALTIVGSFVVYIVQCWGDLGLGTWVGVFIVGPGMALAPKLAMVSGEWPKHPVKLTKYYV